MDNRFWENFYKLPLNNIPWQQTQFDWFKKLVDDGVINGNNALDLGCGTGMKSIYLAKAGFKRVVGIDITSRAIEYAKENAKKYFVENSTEFIVHDVTDLSFLGNEKFDFILDWANIHGLPKEKRGTYATEISNHTATGNTLLLIRTFSNKGTNKEYFESEAGGIKAKIYLLSKQDILNLFGERYDIIADNQSKPAYLKEFSFDEYLMRAK